MKKEEVIDRLEYFCTSERFPEGKYCDRPFRIHMKNGKYFEVRRGNFLNFEDNDSLLIVFTKYCPPPKATSSGSLLFDIFINGGANYQFENQRSIERMAEKKKIIKWYWIKDIG